MSVAICRPSLLPPVTSCWLSQMVKPTLPPKAPTQTDQENEEDNHSFVIWNSIQNNKNTITSSSPPPYIHPLVRRSSILMTQKSLETCTESLGSESGSDEFSSGDELNSFSFESENEEEETEEEEELDDTEKVKKDLFNVNYHCSIGRHRSPLRSFPPPLPSISRRNGPCFKLQPHRRDGRLVVESIPVPSINYLHAERCGGRLLLSFIDSSPRQNSPVLASIQKAEQRSEEELEEEEKEEEEEVEVLDRGTMVKVKISTQAPLKVHRSSLIINKFVVEKRSEEELDEEEEEEEEEEEVEVVDRGTIVEVKVTTQAAVKVHRSSLVINKFVVGSRSSPETETAEAVGKRTTAAAAAASSMSTLTSTTDGFRFNYLHDRKSSRWDPQSPATAEAKLLCSSKRRRSRDELLHEMRRCSELHLPLFIFEQPYCIAMS